MKLIVNEIIAASFKIYDPDRIANGNRSRVKIFHSFQAVIFFVLFPIGLTGFDLKVFANQATVLKTTIENLPNSGNARQIACRLKVYNPNSSKVIAEPSQVTSPLGYSVRTLPSRIPLESGQTAVFDVQISIAKDGNFQVLIPLTVKDSSGTKQFGAVSRDVYFRVTRGSYAVSTYRSLFMNPYARQQDDSGKMFQIYKTGAPPAGWKNSPEFGEAKTDVEQLENMSRETVHTTDWSQPSNFSSKAVFKKTGNLFFRNAPFDNSKNAFANLKSESSNANRPPLPTTAKGTLVYTGADGMLHPAYGWLVAVYMIVNGEKHLLHFTTTKFNGSWEIKFTSYTPFYFMIEYQPRNRFFSFADVSDNTYYSFSSNTIYQAIPNGVINEFTQNVYSAGSDLVNLGELYNDGMILWNNLKRKGRGISPLRDVSITVYYPNDEFDCNRGDDVPWSCSAANYSHIWIIPEHATGRAVMIHELGHQIHAEYWNDDIPGGGEHPAMACTTRGTALTEGFADFLVHWARFDKNVVPAGADTLPVESPAGACTILAQNKVWVAATFWDLYDSVQDGADTFSFSNEGSVIGIFLQNSGLTMMPSTFLFYANAAPQYQQTIFNIYDQNHQNLP